MVYLFIHTILQCLFSCKNSIYRKCESTHVHIILCMHDEKQHLNNIRSAYKYLKSLPEV